MDSDRKERIGSGATRGANLLITLFLLLLGFGGLLAGSSRHGGVMILLLSLGAAAYGVYGIYRYVIR